MLTPVPGRRFVDSVCWWEMLSLLLGENDKVIMTVFRAPYGL